MFVPASTRAESETFAMAKDLKLRTENFQKYLVSLSKYLETHQVSLAGTTESGSLSHNDSVLYCWCISSAKERPTPLCNRVVLTSAEDICPYLAAVVCEYYQRY